MHIQASRDSACTKHTNVLQPVETGRIINRKNCADSLLFKHIEPHATSMTAALNDAHLDSMSPLTLECGHSTLERGVQDHPVFVCLKGFDTVLIYKL